MGELGLPTTGLRGPNAVAGLRGPNAVAGLDRVRWVRVEIRDGEPVCHVSGTRRRRPVMRQVPLATATALIARGVPSVVRHPSVSRRVAART